MDINSASQNIPGKTLSQNPQSQRIKSPSLSFRSSMVKTSGYYNALLGLSGFFVPFLFNFKRS
jgi:hypothetical protein